MGRTKAKGILAACAAISLPMLAACSGASQAPAVTITVTAPAPTTTRAAVATTGAPTSVTPAAPALLELGEEAPLSNGGTVTFYAHQKNVEPQDADQEAIDVQVCVGSKPADEPADSYPTIGQSPWALYDGENRMYTSASTTWKHEAAHPSYPIEQRVNWGDCVRGWVIIDGHADTVMTKVRYTTQNSLIEWKLPL